MPKGIYKHKPNQGFQKGHNDFSTKESRKKISIALTGGKRPNNPSGENHPCWKGGKPKCIDCNKQLKDGYSQRCRKCWIKYNTGENNPFWKGGITKIDKSIRGLLCYKVWRDRVFKRDNYTCQKCNKKNCYVTAHHIKSFSSIIRKNSIKDVIQAKSTPELWDLKNGITLCEKCHSLTDNYKGRGRKK